MATTKLKADIDVRIQFEINEIEARALVDLAGYGTDAFIKAFYTFLGKSYLEQHEAGLRTFLKAVSTDLPPILYRADDARKAYKGEKECTPNT